MLSPLAFRGARRRFVALAFFASALASTGCAKRAALPAPMSDDPFAPVRCTFVAREGTAVLADLFKPAADGAVAALGQPVGYVATQTSFADYELLIDLRWTAKPGNGGILLALGDPASDKVWPRCLQVQFKGGAVGELIPMDGFATAELKPGAKSVPRAADVVESPAGEWNSLRVIVHADTVECWLNGKLACRVTQCSPTSGRIGLQFEGAPWEYRNAKLTPLRSAPGK